MHLHLVESVNYTGPAGLLQVRGLQQELNAALAAKDWDTVRRLDRSCAAVVHKVISANKGDSKAIVNALSELKEVYASLLVQCKREVAS